MKEYAFDAFLAIAVRVKADTLNEALEILARKLDCADCNGGAWDDGSPIVFEASLIRSGEQACRPSVYEVDGREAEDLPAIDRMHNPDGFRYLDEVKS